MTYIILTTKTICDTSYTYLETQTAGECINHAHMQHSHPLLIRDKLFGLIMGWLILAVSRWTETSLWKHWLYGLCWKRGLSLGDFLQHAAHWRSLTRSLCYTSLGSSVSSLSPLPVWTSWNGIVFFVLFFLTFIYWNVFLSRVTNTSE